MPLPVPRKEDIVSRLTGKVSAAWDKFFESLRTDPSSGGGSVFGPESSVDSNLAAFNGTDGEHLEDSGLTTTDVSSAVSLKHTRSHSITGTSDHTSTATSGQILKADSNGLPVDATNTDAEVASAVSLKHAQQHAITSASDHTSTATSAQILKADANGLPVDSSITDAEGLSAVKANRGHRDGLNVTIADATNLYISGGSIDIAGVVYTVDEELTVALGTLVANTLYYIYADAPASGRTLTTGDFTISTTVPVFSHTLGAYYKTGDATKRLVAKYYQAGGSSSLSPAVDSDDGRWGNSLFGPASVNASFGIGATYKSFFRFPDFPANNGDTISSAILTMTSRGTGSSAALDALCCFNDVDDATAPTTYAGAEALVLTAGTAWSSVPDVAQYSNYTTPDCASDLQNVINRAGYALGNAIMMVIKGVSGTGWRMVYDIYDDPTYKASLAIVISASGTTQAINPIKTICDIGRDDGNELNDNDLLVYDSTLGSLKGHASSTAGYVLEADTDGLPSTSSLKATGEEVTITGAGQANTVTLNEGLTVGDGYSGTLTFSAASKTITVEDTSTVNQDLTTDASPTFVTAKLTGLTDEYLPYHAADATGLADSYNTRTQLKETVEQALTGWVNRTDSTLSMDGANFTVSGTSYTFYSEGKKYTYTEAKTVEITNDNTLHFVYFDNDGTLTASTDIWPINSDYVLTAMVYKTGATYAIFDERHAYNRNRRWHSWAHYTIGARYYSGFTGTFTDTTLSLTQGVIEDEDLVIDSGGTLTACRLWYRNTGGSSFTFESNVTTPYKVDGAIQYDNGGTLTDVTNNYYVASYVYATNDQDYPIAVVVGQAIYQNNTAGLNSCRAEALPTIPGSINVEWKLLYQVIYQNSGGSPVYIEANDKRTVSTGPAGVVTSGSHAALVDRDLPNQHTAAAITNVAAGTLTSTDVQSAINELDSPVICRNIQETVANYTLTSGYNGHVLGPFAVGNGYTFEIPDGSKFMVLNG